MFQTTCTADISPKTFLVQRELEKVLAVNLSLAVTTQYEELKFETLNVNGTFFIQESERKNVKF
jgi:hypothetical protein